MTCLKLKNISHKFDGHHVLKDVSVDVSAGEILCLVGPSGCGKSTLLRLVAGLEPLASGEVVCDGETLNNIRPENRNIGLVFQHPSLFPHLTVEENIAFGVRHVPAKARNAIVKKLLDCVGLSGKGASYPHMLSGGQHQRVALARALAPQPKVMLLDEPFANLDHALRYELREDVLNVLKEAGVPVIMVTHNPDEALIMADKMVLLRADGSMHQAGEPEDIHDNPIDLEAANYFGPINVVEGKVDGANVVSPFGNLPKKVYAAKLKNGTNVKVVVRPEGLALAQNRGLEADVEKIAHTGIGHLITARDKKDKSVLFHQYPDTTLKAGDTIRLECVPPHVFVFPK